VLLLTAKDTVADRVHGLRIGADDCSQATRPPRASLKRADVPWLVGASITGGMVEQVFGAETVWAEDPTFWVFSVSKWICQNCVRKNRVF
jgi:hypothetical protein